MSQPKLELERSGEDASLLIELFERSDRLLVKKLSKNDRDWAKLVSKHQGGVYIPHKERDGGFFPPLKAKVRPPGFDEIRETFVRTIWPQVGGEVRDSRLVNYTSKGQETHLTRVPKTLFGELLPASFFVMGRMPSASGPIFHCVTVDSGSEDATLLADLLELNGDFLIGEFDPAAVRRQERERVLDFAEQVIVAWLAGDIAQFAAQHAVMPDTATLAGMARASYLKTHSLVALDPFAIAAPGDALRDISRTVELEIFRDFQRRERAVTLVRLVMGDVPAKPSAADVIRRLVDELPEIDRLMLSASQQRKSRAGYSYEHHIEAMLIGGKIPYQKQVLMESRKRSDFVLPSISYLSRAESSVPGLILSANTTLRERWKQVEREKGARELFLTTVDENIAGNVIEDMASFGVYLVIPESLRTAKETEYANHSNVLSFREFCDVIATRIPEWI